MRSDKHPAPPENSRRAANKVARREVLIGWAFVLPALFMYALLPIVRNTASGLADVPAPLRESAHALGLPAMTGNQLALPLSIG